MESILGKMALANGFCTYKGARYILTQQAYADGTKDAPVYHALAIRDSDMMDDDGWQPAYEIEWSVLEDYDPETSEEYACDWDNPDSVREIGSCNVAQNRFC